MPGIGNSEVRFRCPAPLLAEIRERRAFEQADGEVARRDVVRYYAVLAEELRRLSLSVEEAALVCDALIGYWVGDDPALAMRAWWADVEDHITLNDAAEKWGVSQPAVLVAKCRALSPGASMAVLDAVERWVKRDRNSGETLPESLRAVGLIREVPDSVGWQTDDLADMEGEEWKG